MNETNACPSPVDLTRMFSTGTNDETRAHFERCDRCAAEWASIERVAALAGQLSSFEPSERRAEAVRSALLGAAPVKVPATGRPRLHPLVLATAAAAAIALVLGGYLLLRSPATVVEEVQQTPVADVFRAVVHPHTGAAHAVVGAQPDEIVRLTDGTATFEVDPLQPEERFRVVTGDAEVEVRGTVFDVMVDNDELVSVHVISGEVEVRPYEDEHEILVAGQWWKRENAGVVAGAAVEEAPAIAAVTADDPESPHPAARPLRSTSPNTPVGLAHPAEVRGGGKTSSKPIGLAHPAEARGGGQPPVLSAPAVDPQSAFDEGWSALRSGDFQSAESTLGKAAAGSDPIAEDAAFWRAVALARSGRHAEAARSLQSFLARFPGSPRAGEASVILGRMLLEAGNLSGAEARFRAALVDPGARIRASAAAGLGEVERRRAAATR